MSIPEPNPSGLCMCGCGKPAPIATATDKNRGRVKGKPLRYIAHHQMGGPDAASIARRFWAKVDKSVDPDACWVAHHGRHKSGYGQLRVNGKTQLAHRVVWQLTFGSIPEGLFVLHKCDTPACVNPAHLFVGTPADNMTDMVNKGRSLHRYGGASPSARLKQWQIDDIREQSTKGVTRTDLAKKYGVTQSHVSSIVLHKCWKSVGEQSS